MGFVVRFYIEGFGWSESDSINTMQQVKDLSSKLKTIKAVRTMYGIDDLTGEEVTDQWERGSGKRR